TENTESTENTITPTPQNANTPSRQHTITSTRQNAITPTPKAHKVDADKCIGCKLCVSNCPVNAITMVNGKAVIDPALCINCGICLNGNNDDFEGCPVSAITAPE
ncbi:MAG: 4Fe-4S binding protein, partial [Candidatus Cloacimonas sp.]|nr:4Fe-4S binding protein [Candidatus Cloacimonas sp.]